MASKHIDTRDSMHGWGQFKAATERSVSTVQRSAAAHVLNLKQLAQVLGADGVEAVRDIKAWVPNCEDPSAALENKAIQSHKETMIAAVEELVRLARKIATRSPYSALPHDVLLLDWPTHIVPVKRSESVVLPIQMKAGSVVVWRLLTKTKDISVHIKLGLSTIFGPSRTKGEKWIARGRLCERHAATCTITLDNSYSSTADKVVILQFRVVDAETMTVAEEETNRFQSERTQRAGKYNAITQWHCAAEGGGMVEVQEPARCSRCEQRFSMFKRRHHCRSCMQVVCGECSSSQLASTNHRAALVARMEEQHNTHRRKKQQQHQDRIDQLSAIPEGEEEPREEHSEHGQAPRLTKDALPSNSTPTSATSSTNSPATFPSACEVIEHRQMPSWAEYRVRTLMADGSTHSVWRR
jgi:hypothetical protein